ncbi:MAG: flagellar brake protein [Betaproteobacteria bacterium]|nr:flagellar brake protein [Betaproteobacteria bacterium]
MNDAAFPISAETELDNCIIHSRLEIIPILRDIAAKHALLTIHFSGGADFIVTSLLAVNPDFEEMVIDCGADPVVNARLLAAPRLTAVTFLDHIKIQFSTAGAQQTSFEGAPAFRIRMPDSLLRLQRRNYYRVKVPLARPVVCRVAHPAQPGRLLDLKVLDLSVGGLALLVNPADFDREPGGLVEDCKISLPDHGHFHAELEVRNAEVLAENAKHRLKRLGCQFLLLPGHVGGQIQRYILQVELSRLGTR